MKQIRRVEEKKDKKKRWIFVSAQLCGGFGPFTNLKVNLCGFQIRFN